MKHAKYLILFFFNVWLRTRGYYSTTDLGFLTLRLGHLQADILLRMGHTERAHNVLMAGLADALRRMPKPDRAKRRNWDPTFIDVSDNYTRYSY